MLTGKQYEGDYCHRKYVDTLVLATGYIVVLFGIELLWGLVGGGAVVPLDLAHQRILDDRAESEVRNADI